MSNIISIILLIDDKNMLLNDSYINFICNLIKNNDTINSLTIYNYSIIKNI